MAKKPAKKTSSSITLKVFLDVSSLLKQVKKFESALLKIQKGIKS